MPWWWFAAAWSLTPPGNPPPADVRDASAAPATASAAPSACPSTPPPSDDARRLAPHLLVVWKAERRLALYQRGALATLDDTAACYPIGLAPAAPTAPKRREGDRATPEGWYRTSDKPWSSFAHAIAVHYPNQEDAAAGLRAGLIDRATYQRITTALSAGKKPPQDTALGGEILLHAGGAWDWTLGCVALDEPDLLQLRAALPSDLAVDLWMLP
jgi:hypothetical protein